MLRGYDWSLLAMKKEALIVLALIVFAGVAIAEMALLERFEGPGVWRNC
jgi:hypothetical protein